MCKPRNKRDLESEYTVAAADQSRHIQEQMSGAAMAMPLDPKAAFKAEWEALEIMDHQWALANVETELAGPSPDTIYHQNKLEN